MVIILGTSADFLVQVMKKLKMESSIDNKSEH